MTARGRGAWIAAAALLLVAVGISLQTVGFVVAQHRPIPLLDSWEFADDLRRADAGEYGPGDLWALHNEHRILLPRLLFFADAWLTSWRGTFLLAAILLVQLAHAVVIARLVRRAGGSGPAALATFAFALGCGFAFVQVENLLWSFQIQFVGVFLLATAAAAAMGWHLGLAMLMALLATLTMVNGLIVWPVLLFVAWMQRRPRRELVLLGGAFLLVTVLYLIGWQRVDRHADPLESLGQVPKVFLFAIAYLGNPLRHYGFAVCTALGAVGVGAWGFLAWRAWRQRELVQSALLGAALFVLATALLTGLGRINFDAGYALSSRYATGGLVFWALLGPALFLALGPARRWIAPAAAAGFLLALVGQQRASLEEAIPWFDRMDRATTAAWLGVQDADHLGLVYAWPERQPPREEFLRRARLAHWADGAQDLLGKSCPLPVGAQGPGATLTQAAVAAQPGLVLLRGVTTPGPRLLAVLDRDLVVRGLGLAGVPIPDGALPGPAVAWVAHVRAEPGTELRVVALRATEAVPVGEPVQID